MFVIFFMYSLLKCLKQILIIFNIGGSLLKSSLDFTLNLIYKCKLCFVRTMLKSEYESL